jgi:DNA-directed RNA polymerase specialized sigma subunit
MDLTPKPIGKLEPEFQDAYTAFNLDATPRNATNLLTVLQPTIQKGIQAYAGRKPGTLVKSQARRLALQAARSYNPSQARLSTHVINHLQGLRRFSRQQQEIIHVPERVQLDSRYLFHQEQEFEDQYGREPTIQELADYAKVSVARIEHVNKFRSPLATGTMQSRLDAGGEMGNFNPAVQNLAGHRAWVRAVYDDLNATNRIIMEHTLGLHGKKVLSNQEIARKLRLTPGAVSQRKATIQQLLNQEQELSPFG